MHPTTNLCFLIKKIAPLFKFAVVGSIGLVIDFGITWLLRDGLLINGYIASACGFVVAASSNYYINSKWTFKENANTFSFQFISFFIISLIGLGLKLLLLSVFQNLSISFYASKFLAVVVIFIWNFTANKLIKYSNLSYNYDTEDIDGKKINLPLLAYSRSKVVLRYSELNCDVCVDSALSYFTKFAERIEIENAILLVEYNSADYLSQMIKLNNIKIPHLYHIISNPNQGNLDDRNNRPFLFILDSSSYMKEIFYPLKEIPERSQSYYELMYNKYFRK